MISLDYWGQKFVGILHDPLDKILHKNHVIVSLDIANSLLNSKDPKFNSLQNIISRHHDRGHRDQLVMADRNASATNRGLIPKVNVDKILFQNPFSGYYTDLDLSLTRGEGGYNISNALMNISKKILGKGNLSLDNQDFHILYRDLLLLYYKSYLSAGNNKSSRVLLIIPEDTRLPSSPNISHLYMTSALINTFKYMKPEFYLVMVDIGGVQEFINQSRKTRDLWGSSYLISLLSLHVMKKIASEYGSDTILSPSVLFSPTLEKELLGKRNNTDLHLPLIPATMIFLIPKYRDDKVIDPNLIITQVKDALVEFWGNLITRFIEHLKKIIEKANIKSNERFLEIIENELIEELGDPSDKDDLEIKIFHQYFPKIRITIIDYQKAKNSKLIKDLDKLGCFNLLEEAYYKFSDCFYYPPQELKNFESYIESVSLISNAKKGLMKVKAKPYKERRKEHVCNVCGYRNSFLESVVDEAVNEGLINKEESRDVLNKLKNKLYIDLGERLCALELLKRHLWNIYRKEIGLEKLGVPSVDSIAVSWFYATFLTLLKVLAEENRVEDSKKLIESLLKLLKFEEIKDIIDQLEYLEYSVPLLVKELFDEVKKHYNEHIDELERFVLNFPPELLFEEEIEPFLKRIQHGGQIKVYIGSQKVIEKCRESLNNFYDTIREIFEKNNDLLDKVRNKLIKKISKKIGLKEKTLKDLLTYMNIYLLKDLENTHLAEILGNENILLPLSLKPIDRYALIAADGDSMGDWIRGSNFPPYILLYHPSVAASLTNCLNGGYDSDSNYGKIYIRPRPISASTMETLSLSLILNGRLFARIVEAFGGFVIYSGGDDLLAFSPPETWPLIYMLTRLMFSREISLVRILDDFEDGLYTYGLGWRASISFGIVVADTKADLRMILKEARSLEKKAKKSKFKSKGIPNQCKNLDDKDGFAVSYWSRAGPIRSTANGNLKNILIAKEGDLLTVKMLDCMLISDIHKNVLNKENVQEIHEEYKNVLEEIIEVEKDGEIDFIGISPKKVFMPITDAIFYNIIYMRGLVSKRFLRILEEYRKILEEHKITHSENKDEGLYVLPKGVIREMRYFLSGRITYEGADDIREKVSENILTLVTKNFERYYNYDLLSIYPLMLILNDCWRNCYL